MVAKRLHLKIERTPEEKARIKEIRERFQRERPTPEELVASGEYNEPIPQGAYLELHRLMYLLRKERERQGLSLADVAERCDIDKAALSRLETGQQINPTIDTLWRYAHALGKDLAWAIGDLCQRGQDVSTTLSQVERALENATDLLQEAMKQQAGTAPATASEGKSSLSGKNSTPARSGGKAKKAKARN
jgi:transcriptional regulator with XRE-family HTH domain